MTHPYTDLKEAAIEKIARAWASIDGKADKFDLCKRDRAAEDKMGHYGGYIADAEELAERGGILSLIEENERMREALTPFAEFNTKIDAHPDAAKTPDDYCIHDGLTVGDFRRARAALREKQP